MEDEVKNIARFTDIEFGGSVVGNFDPKLFPITDEEYTPKFEFLELACRPVSEEEIEAHIYKLISENDDKYQLAKSKPMLAGWFIGQVMKFCHGRYSPTRVTAMVQRILFNS